MDVRLPKLGEGADSGTVVGILIKEGEAVAKDQPIMELETEKAVGTIPSSEAGVVEKIYVKVGDKISAGQPILSVQGKEESSDKIQTPVSKPKTDQSGLGRQPEIRSDSGQYRFDSKSGFPPPASPSLRKIAREIGIDLSRVRGSESGGRITIQDVRNYIHWLQATAFQINKKESSGDLLQKNQSHHFAV